jgi:hypothetical protein
MDREQIELACLLVSEVVTNAVLHASITPSPGRNLDFGLGPVPLAVATLAPEPVPAGPRGRTAAAVKTAPVPVQGAAGPGWDGVDSRTPRSPGAPRSPGTPGGPGRPEADRTGAREFAVRLRRGATAVWVEVFDPDLRLPRIRTAGETDEGGRGLYLVEQLATRWGSRPTTDGKAVWFEMPRSGQRS